MRLTADFCASVTKGLASERMAERDFRTVLEQGMAIRPTTMRLLVFCSLASLTAGGNAASQPTRGGQSCRTYATASTTITTSPGGAFSRTLSCSFKATTNQLACTMTLSTCGTVSLSTNYASRADFVDEVSVIPPRMLLTGQTTAPNPCRITDATHTYDDKKRLLQYTIGGLTYRYSAWDSSGRPTSGIITGAGAPTNESWTYTDATRTAVLVQSVQGVSTTTTYHYDANGNPTTVVVRSGGTTSTSTTSTKETAQVCK